MNDMMTKISSLIWQTVCSMYVYVYHVT